MGFAPGRADRHGAGMSLTDRRDDRDLPGDGRAAARTCRRCRSAPRLALMKAEKIPLHFYRYLYESRRRQLALGRAADLLDDEALAEKIHRDGVEIFVLYANGSPAGYYELDFGDPRARQPRLFRADAGMDRPADRAVAARRGRFSEAFSRGAGEDDGEHLHARPSGRPAALSAARLPARGAGRAPAQGAGRRGRFPAILLPG